LGYRDSLGRIFKITHYPKSPPSRNAADERGLERAA
jgi:hypothetical protein